MSASIHAAGDSTEEAKGTRGRGVKSLGNGAATGRGAHACKGEINYFLC